MSTATRQASLAQVATGNPWTVTPEPRWGTDSRSGQAHLDARRASDGVWAVFRPCFDTATEGTVGTRGAKAVPTAHGD